MRYMAGRLAEVDLLDQADAILEELVRFQTTGAEQAEIGAELAALRLINDKPQKAIDILEESTPEKGTEKISDNLFERRKVLQAKAYADAGEPKKALDLLRWDASMDAMRLKADINWDAGFWVDAARVLERLIRRLSIDGVSADERDDIVRLIIRQGTAYALSGNQKGLDRLQEEFCDLMQGSEFAEAFGVITQPISAGRLGDLQSVQEKISGVDLYTPYLESFNQDSGPNSGQSAQ